MKDRARGILVGLAIGDALGAPVEFIPAPSDVHIREMGDKIAHFHKNYRVPEGVWTDDTEMALCIADSLIEKRGYDSYDIMRRFCAWTYEGYRTYDGRPAADVGAQTMNAIQDFAEYPVIPKGSIKTDSAGNGAIMRLAPIIIANSNSEQLLKMAELSCRETHDSIAACAVTELFASSVYLALQDNDKDYIAAHCAELVTDEKYSKFIVTNHDSLFGRSLDSTGAKLCNMGGYIIDAFAIALWGLLNFDSFEDGMLAVLRLGGDTDTNGAIYGQLAGAYYGHESIPEEWRNGVYKADELVEIADKLLGIRDCPIIRTRFEDDEYFKEIG